MKTKPAVLAALVFALGVGATASPALADPAPPPYPNQKGLWPLGMLSRDNMAKPRPKPPFDLTGTWVPRLSAQSAGFNFRPLPKLKPEAQALYEQAQKANAEGKAFRDDTGACWPYGMPKFSTRVWPMQFMQFPTGIIIIQGLENQIRWIYTDGRGHQDPDLVQFTYNGDSVGWWEGDTLVVDTVNLEAERHWIEQGIPAGPKLRIVERIRVVEGGRFMENEMTMIDPDNWDGEWKNTKRYELVQNEDIYESHCLPDLNDNVIGADPRFQAR